MSEDTKAYDAGDRAGHLRGWDEATDSAAQIIEGLAAACDVEIEAAVDDMHRDFWCAQRGQLKRGAEQIREAGDSVGQLTRGA